MSKTSKPVIVSFFGGVGGELLQTVIMYTNAYSLKTEWKMQTNCVEISI
jgi:hypothetical protein